MKHLLHIVHNALWVDLWLIVVTIICKIVVFFANAGESIASGGASNSEASR